MNYAEKAIRYDQQNHYSQSLSHYELSIQSFLQFLQQNPALPAQNSLIIRLRMSEYLQRAEYMKLKVENKKIYDNGVQYLFNGIEYDKIHNYTDAYEAYTRGIELILQYLQYENHHQENNIQIMKQLESYLDRVEVLKKLMNKSSPSVPFSYSQLSAVSEEEKSPTSASAPPISQCVFCLSNPSVYAMIPCGHLILCEECLDEHSTKLTSCFLCRSELIPPKYLRIFST